NGVPGPRQSAYRYRTPQERLLLLPGALPQEFAQFARHAAQIVGRLAQHIALYEGHAQVAERGQFGASLRALRQYLRADLLRILHQRRQQRAVRPLYVNVAHQFPIYLDELRAQFGDGAETAVARAHIVNGNLEALFPQLRDEVKEAWEVVHRLPLGDLDDDGGGRQSMLAGALGQRTLAQFQIGQPFRLHVDEERMPDVLLGGAGEALLQAGDVHPGHQARFVRRAQHRAAAAQQRPLRPAYQGFIGENLPVPQIGDGLKLGAQQLVNDDLQQRIQFRDVLLDV